MNERVMFQPQQVAELSFSHMVLALKSRIQERGYGIFLDNYRMLLRPGVWQGIPAWETREAIA